MTKPWVDMTLRAAGVSLHDCLHKTPKDAGAGYPYISIPQMRSGRLMLSAARRITHADLIEWTKKARPRHNDVVLSRRCNPGETAWVEPGMEFALGQNLVLLRSDGTHVHSDFLRWLSRSPAWWDQVQRFINVGAVFESLRCADVPNFELPIPPLPEQRAIASILGALDDKIDLNRRMNETLEAMARAIFKSWLVDFDPVRAKAEGKQPFGMDADTAALFPDRLVDSEIGPIPEGWEVTTLQRHIDLDKGLSYKGKHLAEAGTPLVNLKCIKPNGGLRADGMKYYNGDYKPRHVVHSGDLVIANTDLTQARDIIGCPAFVPESHSDSECIATHHLFAVRIHEDSEIDTDFLFHLLLTDSARERSRGFATGTTVLGLPRDALLDLPFALGKQEVLRSFNTKARLFRMQAAANNSESRTLAELRDLLLPKLLSGEIRVKDAEKAMEAAI